MKAGMNQTTELLAGYAEPALFLAIFAEQIGIPFPGAAVLVAAGALVADGSLNPVTAMGVTIGASLLADLIWYFIGRKSGRSVLQFLARLSLCDASRFEQTERFFKRHSTAAIVAGKFVPGLSLLVPPLAGAFKTTMSRFVWLDTLGSVLYGLLYMGLGCIFKSEVNNALARLSHIGTSTLLLGLAAAAGFLGWKALRGRKGKGMPAAPSGALAATT